MTQPWASFNATMGVILRQDDVGHNRAAPTHTLGDPDDLKPEPKNAANTAAWGVRASMDSSTRTEPGGVVGPPKVASAAPSSPTA
jgi:hypothetical protein